MKARRERKYASLTVDVEDWSKLQQLSFEKDESVASLIRGYIRQGLSREDGPKIHGDDSKRVPA